MRALFPFLMMIVLLSILGGSVVYLSNQMQFFFDTSSKTPWILIFSGALVYMIGGLLGFSNSNTWAGSLGYKLAAIIMGLALYLILSVLFLDLLQLFLEGPPRLWGFLSLGLTASVFVYGFLNSFWIRISSHKIKMSGLEAPVKVAHLSDIHIGHFRGQQFLQQIVKKTRSLSPDIVVITGDLFDGSIRLNQELLNPLKQIHAPILFVHGNHDGYSGLKSIFELLQKTGVKVLRNQIWESHGIQFIGLNHMRASPLARGMHTLEGPNMKDVLHELPVDPKRPSILLHHSPEGIEFAQARGVDLYLSGHTHGGQQFPVTLINELLFKFNRGLHEFKGTKILVSEGIGTFGPPVRIGTRSEIILIEMQAES